MLLLKLISMLLNDPITFLIFLVVLVVPLLISITFHEWAHGIVAYKFGDPTPKIQGRLTFNPFAHLDVVGTLMLLIVGIGWAKPVEINPNNIKGRTKQLLVSLAGPASNFILGSVFAFIFIFVQSHVHPVSNLFVTVAKIIIKINFNLCVFNLIPIPPLDGSAIIRWILPNFLMELYDRIAAYGFIIILIILFTVKFSFVYRIAGQIEQQVYSWIRLII